MAGFLDFSGGANLSNLLGLLQANPSLAHAAPYHPGSAPVTPQADPSQSNPMMQAGMGLLGQANSQQQAPQIQPFQPTMGQQGQSQQAQALQAYLQQLYARGGMTPGGQR